MDESVQFAVLFGPLLFRFATQAGEGFVFLLDGCPFENCGGLAEVEEGFELFEVGLGFGGFVFVGGGTGGVELELAEVAELQAVVGPFVVFGVD